MKSKIMTLTAALIALISTAQASYRIVIPMEQSRGGALPNGSISITPKSPSLPVEHWQPTDPSYTNWIESGDLYDCQWLPDASTQPIGLTFFQNGSGCKREITRIKQIREMESTTLEIRNTGEPEIEKDVKNNLTTYRSDIVGTLNDVGCKFNPYTSQYQWLDQDNGGFFNWYLTEQYVPNGKSIEINGYIYSKGELGGIFNETKYYAVCKEKLL